MITTTEGLTVAEEKIDGEEFRPQPTYQVDIAPPLPEADARYWAQAVCERVPVDGRVLNGPEGIVVRFYGTWEQLRQLRELLTRTRRSDDTE